MAKQSFPDPAVTDPSLPARPVPVLITRPEPQAGRFAAALQQRFGDRVAPVVSPLMRLRFLDAVLPAGPFTALVLTSESGAAGAARLRAEGAPLPACAFCVGDRTAEAARAAGFQACSASGDARDLVTMIRAGQGGGTLLYLHGTDRAADLAAMLPERPVASVAVYAQDALPLTDAARALLKGQAEVSGPIVLPVFSPRSARLFGAAAGQVGVRLTPVAISEAARLALPQMLAEQAVVAERPDAAAMIQAIAGVIGAAVP